MKLVIDINNKTCTQELPALCLQPIGNQFGITAVYLQLTELSVLCILFMLIMTIMLQFPCVFFSAGNIQKEMMALIPTSTFPTIPTFPLGPGDVASVASTAAKRSLLLSSIAMRSAFPAEHSSWFPDNMLERQPMAHSSRRGFCDVVCENLMMCVVLRIAPTQLRIPPAT